jgi:methylmalonyl-CoA/ethylmalonyl-CoA epimerase
VSRDLGSRLTPGSRGGVERVEALPTATDLARLDPSMARTAILRGPTSKRALLDALAVALEFPGWFGHNWDALDELLRVPQPPDDRAIVIVWHDPERLPQADRETALAVFESAAEDRRRLGLRPLVVMIRAETEPQRAMNRSDVTHQPPTDRQEFGPMHHVGLVVRDLDEAVGLYRDGFGLPLESLHDLEADGIRAAFLGSAGARIELLQPTRSDTGVARFLESRGPGLHHICFEVGDLGATLDALAAAGFELIDPRPRRGAHGPVAFIHPRSGLGALVELIEAPGGPAWAALGFDAS